MLSLPNRNKLITENWRKDIHAIEKYTFLHQFIPHVHQKRRARLLAPSALAFYSIMVLFTLGVLRLLPIVTPGVLGYASDIYVKELLDYTNQRRRTEGLPDLQVNTTLSTAAQKKAEHMFKLNYWAHTAPDGTEPWDFVLASGYDYSYAGENLAKNFSYSREVVDAWYKSPTHKENLMSKNYDEVGFAVVNGVLDGYETTLVVQMFGKSRHSSYTASVPPAGSEIPPAVTTEVQVPTVQDSAVAATSTPAYGAYESSNARPVIDVSSAFRVMTLAFTGFLILLLGLDIWYSKSRGIVKINGHTIAHLGLLLLVALGIWFAVVPGNIL